MTKNTPNLKTTMVNVALAILNRDVVIHQQNNLFTLSIINQKNMSGKSKFLIGLATAVITFGTLFATLGKQHFIHGCKPCHAMHHCCMQDENEMKNCNACPAMKAESDSLK